MRAGGPVAVSTTRRTGNIPRTEPQRPAGDIHRPRPSRDAGEEPPPLTSPFLLLLTTLYCFCCAPLFSFLLLPLLFSFKKHFLCPKYPRRRKTGMAKKTCGVGRTGSGCEGSRRRMGGGHVSARGARVWRCNNTTTTNNTTSRGWRCHGWLMVRCAVVQCAWLPKAVMCKNSVPGCVPRVSNSNSNADALIQYHIETPKRIPAPMLVPQRPTTPPTP